MRPEAQLTLFYALQRTSLAFLCGIIASLAASADRNTNTSETSHSLEESDKAVENDAFLCTQYRLALSILDRGYWTDFSSLQPNSSVVL
jgi:hypothetical protein